MDVPHPRVPNQCIEGSLRQSSDQGSIPSTCREKRYIPLECRDLHLDNG